MIYLDNAATEFPKPRSVLCSVNECISKYCGNPSRSAHFYSIRASEEIYLAREAVSEEFGSHFPERVVFTQNTTHALNVAIKCLIAKPCHILISDSEHNSVLRPVVKLCENDGFSYSEFNTDGNLIKNIESAIRKDTGAIVTTLSSNVTGRILSPKLISETSKKHGLISIVDAAQLAGHSQVDLASTPFSAFCAPAHKGLYGIQGAGFVIFDDPHVPRTLLEGGSGTASGSLFMPDDLPERLEAGTLPTPSIVSLRHGIEFINDRGQGAIKKHIDKLSENYIDILTKCGAQVFGGECGIVSFRFNGISCDALSYRLSDAGICIRSGLHCAPLMHKKLGTLDTGLIRISLSAFSKQRDCDRFRRILRSILD